MTTDDQFGATCLECGILRLHIVNLERDLAAARAEVARLREAIQAALDSPNHMSSEDIDILLAALDTPAREGGEG